MMKRYLIFFGCLLLLAVPVWSQNWTEKGHQQFEELAYSDAIKSLEKAVEKGSGNTKVYTELADSYYFNADYKASAKGYQLLFKKPDNILPIHYFRYAQALKSIGKHEKAAQIIKEMMALFPKETLSLFNTAGDTAKAKKSTIVHRFKIKIAPFNSAVSDFGPSFFGSQLVFASARDTGSVFKRNHSWTNQSFTDLYTVANDSVDTKPIRFSKVVNSKLNESTAVFTHDGLTVYFTRNNLDTKKVGKDKGNITLLKIYKAEKKDTDWKIIGALPFCDDAYNVAHPALSADEKTLYFASDKPGGFGQSDLYKVDIKSDGTFGSPQNLGAALNTFGRETFPFSSANNDLYFASDGHEGLGGLDIFVAKAVENQSFSKPQNLGEPINSRMDDFGFIFNTLSKTGFFTSNRSGGIGMDDIYAFEELIPLPCETILKGKVALKNTKDFVSNVQIILLDANSNQVATTQADEEGNYKFTIDCTLDYAVKTAYSGYVSQTIKVEPLQFVTTALAEILLEKDQLRFKIGDDVAKKINLLPIFFDLGKSTIREDAAVELAKIKIILVEYPKLTIEIRSHTDSRDTFDNNQILSNQRAASTLIWFVENGIEASRLQGIGYGETQLINRCADGVPCSEEAHQLNRRSAFIVTGI